MIGTGKFVVPGWMSHERSAVRTSTIAQLEVREFTDYVIKLLLPHGDLGPHPFVCETVWALNGPLYVKVMCFYVSLGLKCHLQWVL